MRTQKNILQHELIGLRCRVVDARNKANIGIAGKIADETLKMIVVAEKISGKQKSVMKAGSKFRIWLGEVVVDIDGDAILARPEDRIKKIVKRW